ncbi:outer membrane protein [Vibrio cortegadensis]|uniref:Outer membrane protein n=1 Tax=Vibrio cortegadensis TaxID=1328770 RepID=A0ABV4M3X9_9VIBR
MTRFHITSLLYLLMVAPFTSSAAEFFITPMVGYTLGGGVEDESDNNYDLSGAVNYSIALETPLDQGRIGLFYSNQSSELDDIKLTSSVQYLHFQSSIYYPATNNISGYLGLGIGGSYVDVDWVKDKYGFSASLFGGVEYQLSCNVALTSQVRWLGTVVDNETSGQCTLPTTGNSCTIRFKTDWMNQFQTNVGLRISF